MAICTGGTRWYSHTHVAQATINKSLYRRNALSLIPNGIVHQATIRSTVISQVANYTPYKIGHLESKIKSQTSHTILHVRHIVTTLFWLQLLLISILCMVGQHRTYLSRSPLVLPFSVITVCHDEPVARQFLYDHTEHTGIGRLYPSVLSLFSSVGRVKLRLRWSMYGVPLLLVS